MRNLVAVQEKYAKAGKLGPVARLLPTTAATTLRKVKGEALVIDGPFAETKEQLLGFYTIECDDLEEAVGFARELSDANPERRLLRDTPRRRAQPGRRQPYDRHRLDKSSAHRRETAGGGGAAALFPRPRHGGGGVPGGLPSGAEELAAERPAARPDRLADLRRPQHGDRRGAPPVEARAAAGRAGAVRSRGCRNGDRRTARRRRLPRRHIAAALHLLPSGPAGDAADRARAAHRVRPLGQADRARLPGRRKRDGAAHHARQGKDRAGRGAVRGAGPCRAFRAARRGRRHGLSRLQRGLFGERRRRIDARAALRRGDPAGAAAAAPVPDRARDHGADGADASPACARGRAVRCRTARWCCSRTRTAANGTPR